MNEFLQSEPDEYRTIDEQRIFEMVLLRGWPIEVLNGNRPEAEPEVRAALDQWLALGLPHRIRPDGQRTFDPVEAANFVIWAGRRLGDPTYAKRYVATARSLVAGVHGHDQGRVCPATDTLGPGRYRITFQRRFNLSGCDPDKRLRLCLPVPVEDDGLTDLGVEYDPPPGLDVDIKAHASQIQMTLAAPEEREVTIGARFSFTAWPLPRPESLEPLDATTRDLYLRLSEGLIRVTPRIEDLAVRLAGDAQDAMEILRRFWNYMMNDLWFGSIHYDQIAPSDPLQFVFERRLYDCRLGSAFLAALCRARGIPARMVSGYVLHRAAPGFHTWLEVWTGEGGWLPVDLYSWSLEPDTEAATAWRNHFFGHVDHRMVTERPPRIFSGTGSIRLPPRWHLLHQTEAGGVTAEFRSRDDDQMVYAEHVKVEPLDLPEPRPRQS